MLANDDLVKSFCDNCRKKVNLDDMVNYRDPLDIITWYDGTSRPRLRQFCTQECLEAWKKK